MKQIALQRSLNATITSDILYYAELYQLQEHMQKCQETDRAGDYIF